MFLFALLIEVSNGNLLFGFAPEPLVLLVFGVGLVGLTIALRRLMKMQNEKKTGEDLEKAIKK